MDWRDVPWRHARWAVLRAFFWSAVLLSIFTAVFVFVLVSPHATGKQVFIFGLFWVMAVCASIGSVRSNLQDEADRIAFDETMKRERRRAADEAARNN